MRHRLLELSHLFAAGLRIASLALAGLRIASLALADLCIAGLCIAGLCIAGLALAPLPLAAQQPGRLEPGLTLLPNGWMLSPAGASIPAGDLPLGLDVAPNGRFAVLVNSGVRRNTLTVVNLSARKVSQTLPLRRAWNGVRFAPDGHTLYVTAGNDDEVLRLGFKNGRLETPDPIPLNVDGIPPGASLTGLDIAPDGSSLYVVSKGNRRAYQIDVATRTVTGVLELPGPLYACRFDAARARLYVSVWGRSQVAVIDTATWKVQALLRVGDHPTELVQSPDGQRLFVANANHNTVSVIDLEALKVTETLSVAPVPAGPNGSTPTSLAVNARGDTLYVAAADNNAVAVVDISRPGASRVRGFIPTGWYPTVVRCVGNTLLVANGKGESSRSNPKGAHLAGMLTGTLSFIPVPDDRQLEAYTRQVLRNTPLTRVRTEVAWEADNPIPRPGAAGASSGLPEAAREAEAATGSAPAGPPSTGPTREAGAPTGPAPEAGAPTGPAPAGPPSTGPTPAGPPSTGPTPEAGAPTGSAPEAGAPTGPALSPIKHVFYIIKENRTYDQLLGDLPQGNGDPSLTLFGREVTPNHHALAETFVLFDNFYVDAEVSADGHNWSTAAYATDYVEKTWPTWYGGRGGPWDFDRDGMAAPSDGYLWDSCLRHGVSLRNYGEFALEDAPPGVVRPNARTLAPLTSPTFRGWDLHYTDRDRADAWLQEFDAFEASDSLPQLQIIRLPNDHTAGTRLGFPSPRAMVADNDVALGRIVERITHSRYWPESAIFVLEDDAQNGPDHVDAHRSVALVISPFIRRGYVDHTLYTTSSVLRTLELILGLPPMSQFDAGATPMFAAFTARPDLTAYSLQKSLIDLEEKNALGAYGQDRMATMDLDEADGAPDLELNEIIWGSLRGVAMPPPVRSAWLTILLDPGLRSGVGIGSKHIR